MFKDLLKRLRKWWNPQTDFAKPRSPEPPIRPQPTEQPVLKLDRKEGSATPKDRLKPTDAPSIEKKSGPKDGGPIQIPKSDGGRVFTVRIGVDFGTAFTKAAIRVAESVIPVRWSDEIGGDGYFLPCVMTLLKDDTVRLGGSPDATEECKGLKEPFLPGAVATDLDRARAIAFVALVLRYCRTFMLQTHRTLVKGRRLAWVLNIGCPTNIYSAETLTQDYRRMFLIAWEISQSPADIRLSDVVAAMAGPAKSPDQIDLDSIEAIPEFVAQVAVYARSPQRQDGLHLLVDCGAGTLDIATFNVYRKPGTDQDMYPILESEVAPLGTHFLMNEFSALKASVVWPDIEPVPTNAELRDLFGLRDSEIHQTENRFQEKVTETVLRVLRKTKQSRHPNAAAWSSGLPIFLSGGGSSCPIYEKSVEKAGSSMNATPRHSRFPLPEGLARNTLDLPDSELHRLSVAFGLTYDPEIIGKVYRRSETPDMILPQKRRPSSDELYAK
jgi:hypothetical protein